MIISDDSALGHGLQTPEELAARIRTGIAQRSGHSRVRRILKPVLSARHKLLEWLEVESPRV